MVMSTGIEKRQIWVQIQLYHVLCDPEQPGEALLSPYLKNGNDPSMDLRGYCEEAYTLTNRQTLGQCWG